MLESLSLDCSRGSTATRSFTPRAICLCLCELFVCELCFFVRAGNCNVFELFLCWFCVAMCVNSNWIVIV